MAARDWRPGRTLSIFLIVIALMYGLAALAGSWKPKLGLDLAGGTQYTLVPAKGSDVSGSNLNQAVSIIRQRVNGNGVSEAQVSTAGNNVVVKIPGPLETDAAQQEASIARQAQLRFRVVARGCGTSGSSSNCIADGLPAKSTNTATGSSKKPTTSPSKSPSSSATKTTSPSATPTAKGNGRPAFYLGGSPAAKHTPTPMLSIPLEAPAPPPGEQVDTGPVSADSALTWASAPPAAWSTYALAVAKCDPAAPGNALVPPFVNEMTTNSTMSATEFSQDFSAFETANAAYVKQNPTKPEGLYVAPTDAADRPIIACNPQADGGVPAGYKYLLSPATINGDSITNASATTGQNSAGWVVNLTFNDSGTKVFYKLSSDMVSGGTYSGMDFAIVLDGSLLSAPGFNGVINNGNAQITGTFTSDSATQLANALKFGSLPIKFDLTASSFEAISAQLAGTQLTAGIIAGVVGLLIVMIYCFFYYRGLGIVVVASLVIAALVTYATVLLLGKTANFTLSLPGIAGMIVAVGITADSFIVYFERIRDEMREGKSMRVAVQAAWVRARNTCMAADTVSLLAAISLYLFAIDEIRGFAFALGVTTLIDLIVFFFFTHPVVSMLSVRPFFNDGHRLSGLSPESLGIQRRRGLTRKAGA